MFTVIPNALRADRSGERFLYMTLPLLVAMTAFILVACTTSVAPRYVAMMLMVSGIDTGYVIVLAWIANTITRPAAKRAATLTLINGLPSAASIYVPNMSGGAPRYITAFSDKLYSVSRHHHGSASWHNAGAAEQQIRLG